MFSPQVTGSDRFLDMPVSAQALYFQLGMNADDDGFIGSARRVMRMIGSNEDDLKILIAKGFVIEFDSGIMVIRHWKVNNLVRRDWYRPSIFGEREEIRTGKNGVYFHVNELVNDSTKVASTKAIPLLVNESVNVGRKVGRKEEGFFEQHQAEIDAPPKHESVKNIRDILHGKRTARQ